MVGTDIIEVARIEKLIREKGDKFLNKIYTQDEIDYCESKGPNKYQHYAGRFTAKEAVYKACCNSCYFWIAHEDDFPKLSFYEIEIISSSHSSGPHVEIYNDYYNNIMSNKNITVAISISHIKKYATAVACLEFQNLILYHDKLDPHK